MSASGSGSRISFFLFGVIVGVLITGISYQQARLLEASSSHSSCIAACANNNDKQARHNDDDELVHEQTRTMPEPSSQSNTTTSAANDDDKTQQHYYHNLTQLVAPAFFPINGETGKINFPTSVNSVVIDVGARQSDYLAALERNEDNTTAVILVDPLPDSLIPLGHRVTGYAMRGRTMQWLDATKSNQAFYIRAAMGETEGHVDFGVAAGPSCGSILKTSEKNNFWCAKTTSTLKTIVLSLEGLVALFPDQIQYINLKVDAEGADLVVLKGAGSAIGRFDTIIIECNSKDMTRAFRVGECTENDAVEYMERMNFKLFSTKGQNELVNMFFTNSARKLTVPPFLKTDGLEFLEFYSKLAAVQ